MANKNDSVFEEKGKIYRVGLLVPSTDLTMESDLKKNLPDNITFHSARMYLAGVTVEDEEKMLVEEVPKAAKELRDIEPDVAVFACTSAGALFGPEGDVRLKNQIHELIGCPVVTVFGSVLSTIKASKPERLMIITPYTNEVNKKLHDAFIAGGVPIHSMYGMNLTADLDIARVPHKKIFDLLDEKISSDKPDFVFLSCTNLRAWEVLSYAVDKYKLPVISSNFATYRNLLSALGFPSPSLENPTWG